MPELLFLIAIKNLLNYFHFKSIGSNDEIMLVQTRGNNEQFSPSPFLTGSKTPTDRSFLYKHRKNPRLPFSSKRLGVFRVVLLLLSFSIFNHSAFAIDSEIPTKEWIIYTKSEDTLKQFNEDYPSNLVDSKGLVVKGTFTYKEIETIRQLPGIESVEPNYSKFAASDLTFNDPFLSEQWALDKIDVTSVINRYKTKSKNLLIGKKVVTENDTFSYSGESIDELSFQVGVKEEQLSRISLELDHVEGAWGIEFLDEEGNIIASNEGAISKLDVLLPKKRTFATIKIKIKKTEQWETQPIITDFKGVNNLLIAVIDSGVVQHEDFCDNILYSLGKDYREGMVLATDRFGHGTHITGILAACPNNGIGITGVLGHAPVDILPLKVLDRYGNGGDFEISKAVEDAVEMGADIVNLSLAGTGETKVLRDAIYRALQQNIVVVAAAGNGNTSTDRVYPAAYPGVITVSGTDWNNDMISIANFGWEVDISAPGEKIVSSYLQNGYQSFRGTSMATPFVTGAVAFMKLENPDLDVIQIREQLFAGALDINENGYDQNSGAGLVQFTKATRDVENESIEWLTLKNGQPLDVNEEHILALSKKLVGDRIFVFSDEELLVEKKAAGNWIDLSLESISSERGETIITVLAVDDQQKVDAYDQIKIKLTKAEQSTSFIDVDVDSTNNSYFNSSENSTSFTDFPGDYWAVNEIQRAAEKALINGYTDGTFRPDRFISRRHGLMILSRLFEWKVPKTMSSPFKDVTIEIPGSLAIFSGFEESVVKGYGNGQFYPEKPLTRGQMAVILARALNVSETSYDGEVHLFQDVGENHFAFYAVEQLASKGIITKQDRFRPNEYVTRAQFTAMVMRTYDFLRLQ